MNESTKINWYPGHMAKTKKQIIEDLKLIDVVIEILDARIPISSRNPDLESLIENKERIIILNKVDLADEYETKEWINLYKKKGVTAIAVNSNSGNGIAEVIKNIKNEYEKIKEKYIKTGRIGKTIKVMVIGIPNVGKSSFINKISKRNAQEVGNKPGVTKQKKWIKLDEGIELMDTPGMLWPKIENSNMAINLAFVGTIGEKAIDNEEIAYYLIEYLAKEYPNKLIERYNIELEGKETIEIIEEIAKKRGALISGGNVDLGRISDIILNEFRSGKIGRITIEFPR